MTMEWVIGIAGICALVGIGLGLLLPYGRGTQKARVAELESALDASQAELADYRSEVYGQFAQTADKFKKLDESYQDLHRQLAASAVALCGDEATPLLIGGNAAEVLAAPVVDAAEASSTEDAAVTASQSVDDVVDEAVADFQSSDADTVETDSVQGVNQESVEAEPAVDADDVAERATEELTDAAATEPPAGEVAVEIPTITDALLEQEAQEAQKEIEKNALTEEHEVRSNTEKGAGELKQSA